MVPSRALLFALCTLTIGLHGSDNEAGQSLLMLDQQVLLESPIREELSISNMLPQSQQGSFFSALGVVRIKVVSATLLLNNTFGRMALAAFLGYKGYKSATKIMQEGVKRSKHVLRTLLYLGATCMLLSDGYDWVMRQGADA